MNLFNFSRRTLPMILQDATGECGLACISMISQWHGHKLDLLYLRSTYPTTRRGLSLANLAAVANQLRFDVRGYSIDDLSDLSKVRLPAILHWDKNHFVVLKAVSRNRFTIHNPAVGVRQYSRDELAEHFSGAILELSAADMFETIVRAKKYTLRRILESVHGLKASLIQTIVIATVGSLVAMLIPVFVQVALDSVLPRNDVNLLAALAIGIFFVSLTTSVSEWLQKRIVANAGSAFFAQLTRNAVGHIFRLPLRYFESRHPGDIATRLESVNNVRNVVTKSFVVGVVDLLMIVFSGTIMFLYAPALAAVVTAIFLVVIAIRLISYPNLLQQGSLALKAQSDERSRLIDNLRAVAALKSANATVEATSRWYDSFVKYVNASFRVQITEANAVFVIEIVTAIGIAVTVYYGVAAVMAQKLTVGMLYAFFTYRSIFFDRIDNLVTTMTEVSMLRANMTRLSDFLEEPPEPAAQPVSRQIKRDVVLRAATYRAGFADSPILKSIDLEIKAHASQTVVILGPSGSGKTTLLKILSGLYTPTEGAILVDGIPLNQWGLDSFRRNIGLLLGSDKLARGSILENISCFSFSPEPGRAEAALRVACLDQAVSDLPRQLDSVVSEENGLLSSGERRRLMLARALYDDPAILLLDEVTSNLDPDTALEVMRNLSDHPSTKIITSHDRLVLDFADVVYRMEDGRLTLVDALDEQHSQLV